MNIGNTYFVLSSWLPSSPFGNYNKSERYFCALALCNCSLKKGANFHNFTFVFEQSTFLGKLTMLGNYGDDPKSA